MTLEDIRGRGMRPGVFVPARQESDHRILYDHTSTAVGVAVIETITIPKGVNAVLMQAIDQNIRYVLVGGVSGVSGFRLTAGNDPIAVRVIEGMALQFIAEAAGAFLEMQFGIMT